MSKSPDHSNSNHAKEENCEHCTCKNSDVFVAPLPILEQAEKLAHRFEEEAVDARYYIDGVAYSVASTQKLLVGAAIIHTLIEELNTEINQLHTEVEKLKAELEK